LEMVSALRVLSFPAHVKRAMLCPYRRITNMIANNLNKWVEIEIPMYYRCIK
jgi:hypothetical protein